jgi:hypothetical protein
MWSDRKRVVLWAWCIALTACPSSTRRCRDGLVEVGGVCVRRDAAADVQDASDVPDVPDVQVVPDVPDGGCVGGRDLPGDHLDCDGDGVDGVATETIFVAPSGNDANTGLTHDQAVRTLERVTAILHDSSGQGRRSILIQNGLYDTSVLVAGVGGSQYVEPLFWIDRAMTVSGGYSVDWVHLASGSNTTLRGIDVGLIVTGTRGCGMPDEITPLPASAAVTLNDLQVNVLTDTEMGTRTRRPGSNCMGLLLRRVEGPVTLKSVTFDVCAGAPGQEGMSGMTPSPPMPGGDATERNGGDAGLGCGGSVASRGGVGGLGGAGSLDPTGEHAGGMGESGLDRGDAGAIGGRGGTAAATMNGVPGGTFSGSSTAPAANGDQGGPPLWTCDGPLYQLGGAGRDGADGVGGGGGGGGAANGQMGNPGGGGGGGGGGGCGGRGGGGGGNGGASVGVYAYYSCDLHFELNNTQQTVILTPRGGGEGGAGGRPSPAGDGGAGGAGASSPDGGTSTAGGAGGAGGAGSPGQPGGQGGGGQGGVNVGVLAVGCPSLPPNLSTSVRVNLNAAGGNGGPPHTNNRGAQTAVLPVAPDGGVLRMFPCSQMPELPRGMVLECPRDGGM